MLCRSRAFYRMKIALIEEKLPVKFFGGHFFMFYLLIFQSDSDFSALQGTVDNKVVIKNMCSLNHKCRYFTLYIKIR